MKKFLMVLLICFFVVPALSGCGAVQAPVSGLIYTGVQGPGPVTQAAEYSKTGEASCTSILGLIATGDASVKAAMENGGIKKIHHVDYKSTNILGLFGKFTTVVYGD